MGVLKEFDGTGWVPVGTEDTTGAGAFETQAHAVATFETQAHAAATFAARTADNVFTGKQRFAGYVGIGSTDGEARLPYNGNLNLDSAAVGTSGPDVIGFNETVMVTGSGWGVMGGPDPGFVWGRSLFAATGPAAGDGAGITSFIGLNAEADIQTPAGTTFPVVRGVEACARLFGASAGATITQAESLRASAPKRSAGAVAGTIGTAYSIFVEGPTVGGANFAIFADGIVRITNRVDVNGQVVATSGQLTLQADFSSTSLINIANLASGGDIQYRLSWVNGQHRFQDNNGAQIMGIDTTGHIVTHPNVEKTGAGSAALGANCPAVTATAPFKWIEAKLSDGSIVYLPAWK